MLGTPGGGFIPVPKNPHVVYPVDVVLQRVANLTLVKELAKIRMSVQALTGDWKGSSRKSSAQPVPTQVLGKELFAIPGLEAFITVSAKQIDYLNLVVFPQKLLRGSSLRFTHPASKANHLIKGKLDPP